MTLDRWLQEATAGLPPEVAQRVRAEYAAHVVESGLPEGDAVASLGRPEAVRRALGRTYVSGERLRTLREASGTGLMAVFMWLGLVLFGGGQALIWVGLTPFPWERVVGPLLTLALTAALWLWTAFQPAERRTFWRTFWMPLSLGFMLWAGPALQLGRGQDVPLAWAIPLLGLLLGVGLLWTLWDDRRLRRTLALREDLP